MDVSEGCKQAGMPPVLRRLDPAGHFGAQSPEVLHVPGVDDFRLDLPRAARDQRPVQHPPNYASGCGFPDGRGIFPAVECDDRQMLFNRFQKQQDLFPAQAMLSRQPGQSGIEFRQAVRGAAGSLLVGSNKGGQTGLVVLVVFHENRD
jgi:hypothetical protein